MPNQKGAILPREIIFAKAMAMTGDIKYAAVSAGYDRKHANAKKLNPIVADEIRRLHQDYLWRDLLPTAVARHHALLLDDKTPAAAHNRAIEIAYKYTLGSTGGSDEKELHEMSAAELEERLADLKRQASERATVVIEGEATTDDQGDKPDLFE